MFKSLVNLATRGTNSASCLRTLNQRPSIFPSVLMTRQFSSASAKLSVQEVEDRVMELLKNFSKTKQEKVYKEIHERR